ncbi:polysaccharide deacetylase family protein [Micromonospora echinofusca]|uniref:Polysaccharide deacetylase family protein n=1 Tax=Micromonospora echinofusca TaxID=47858 RepID=A0ABS3VLS0_MICEH|nr:polysaccharide deacetylase family protein [Micromonospora echinofusca]MBO4205339.1 polysaccharide deacetylase family protein [Micromonospora echinofusca]
MTPRAAFAACTALLMLATAGCADQDRPARPAAGGTDPTASAPATVPPSVAPTRRPAPTPTVRPTTSRRPAPTALPPGLRRTTGVRGVALTFDDGPHPQWTPKVLDQLRAAGVKATFCVVGSKVRQHPALVVRIVREGHQLCNHSWQHDVDLGTRPEAQIRADLARTNQAIRAAVPGARIPYYRQPGGRWTPEVVAAAKGLGMQSLHWTVDPQDWAKPTASVISKRVTDRVRPGSIVLLHDGGGDRSATLRACPGLIASIKQRYGVTRLK